MTVAAPRTTMPYVNVQITTCASREQKAGLVRDITDSLVQRAAAVTLKERRRLIIAHRESPLNLIDIRNMSTLTEAGAIIAPLAPGFYLLPTTIDELSALMAMVHGMPLVWFGNGARSAGCMLGNLFWTSIAD